MKRHPGNFPVGSLYVPYNFPISGDVGCRDLEWMTRIDNEWPGIGMTDLGIGVWDLGFKGLRQYG